MRPSSSSVSRPRRRRGTRASPATAASATRSCPASPPGYARAWLPLGPALTTASQIEAQIRKTTPSSLEESARELQDWKAQLAEFQGLVPKQATLDALRQTDVPAEERKVKKEEERLAAATGAAERVSDGRVCGRRSADVRCSRLPPSRLCAPSCARLPVLRRPRRTSRGCSRRRPRCLGTSRVSRTTS
jgi:hypothetical protein